MSILTDIKNATQMTFSSPVWTSLRPLRHRVSRGRKVIAVSFNPLCSDAERRHKTSRIKRPAHKYTTQDAHIIKK